MRCVPFIGDLITHPRQQLECSPVAKFGIELAFEDIEDVPQIAPVIRQVAGGVFHLAHPQITDSESAPDGFPTEGEGRSIDRRGTKALLPSA